MNLQVIDDNHIQRHKLLRMHCYSHNYCHSRLSGVIRQHDSGQAGMTVLPT
jgi:hypothetical protein